MKLRTRVIEPNKDIACLCLPKMNGHYLKWKALNADPFNYMILVTQPIYFGADRDFPYPSNPPIRNVNNCQTFFV